MKYPKCKFFSVRCQGLFPSLEGRDRCEEKGEWLWPQEGQGRRDGRASGGPRGTGKSKGGLFPALSSASVKPAARGSFGDTGKALSLGQGQD